MITEVNVHSSVLNGSCKLL